MTKATDSDSEVSVAPLGKNTILNKHSLGRGRGWLRVKDQQAADRMPPPFLSSGIDANSGNQPVGQISLFKSNFAWRPSGKFRSDGFETPAQPTVTGIGGMAWMPIHRFVDVREIEWRLHQSDIWSWLPDVWRPAPTHGLPAQCPGSQKGPIENSRRSRRFGAGCHDAGEGNPLFQPHAGWHRLVQAQTEVATRGGRPP
jgi:hypothetical protein